MLLVAAIGVPLSLALCIDLVSAGTWWQLLAFVAVAALALTGLTRRSPRLMTVAVAASLAVTTVLAATAPDDFTLAEPGDDNIGFVELGALLLVVGDRWRVAARAAGWLLVAATSVAVIALALRVGLTNLTTYPDNVVWTAIFVDLAVTIGAVLRGQVTHRRIAVAAVRRDERMRIARELHDVVAHHVTGIVVATQGARVVAAHHATPPTDAAGQALRAIEHSGLQALAAMRRLVGILRTEADAAAYGPLSPVPVLSDLGDLVQRFRETGAVGHVQLDTLLDGQSWMEPEYRPRPTGWCKRRWPTQAGTLAAPPMSESSSSPRRGYWRSR